MISKKIHYFWVGPRPIAGKNRACIESWKKFCPDYEVIEWNESNYDITKCTYMKQAYESQVWGFVPDYARLDIIYQEGGIYLDTDVEVIRNLDGLLSCKAFMGFEDRNFVALGLGFGAEKGNPLIKQMREAYHACSFLNDDGTPNLTPSPAYTTEFLKTYGLRTTGRRQKIQDIDIFPADYFAPLCFYNRRLKITKNTYSIHWYHASWHTAEEKKQIRQSQRVNRIFGRHMGRVVNRGLRGIQKANNYFKGRGK